MKYLATWMRSSPFTPGPSCQSLTIVLKTFHCWQKLSVTAVWTSANFTEGDITSIPSSGWSRFSQILSEHAGSPHCHHRGGGQPPAGGELSEGPRPQPPSLLLPPQASTKVGSAIKKISRIGRSSFQTYQIPAIAEGSPVKLSSQPPRQV